MYEPQHVTTAFSIRSILWQLRLENRNVWPGKPISLIATGTIAVGAARALMDSTFLMALSLKVLVDEGHHVQGFSNIRMRFVLVARCSLSTRPSRSLVWLPVWS